MPETTPLEEANVELTSTLEERERAVPDPDDRFRILVLGDFSGRESRSEAHPAELGRSRTPVRVDRDSIEELPGELGTKVRLHLLEHGAALTFPIETLEDLHPDRIFTGHAAFAGLRKTRLGLESDDPAEFSDAANSVRGWSYRGGGGSGGSPKPPKELVLPHPIKMPPQVVPIVPREIDKLAEELLEKSKRRQTTDDVDELARQVSAPFIAPMPPAERGGLISRTDESIGSWMRTLLREPVFHDLESAWRSLELLVRRADEDTTEIHVLDVSRAELGEDLRRSNLSESGAYRILVEDAVETPGGKPWSVIVGLWGFSPNIEDVALLGRLAKLARAAGAPFLAGASPRLARRDGFAEGAGMAESDDVEEALWQALRGAPGAEWIGLVLPRVLLRLPYGQDTDPIEEFPFEEGEDLTHEDLLWGSPAAVCALLLSQSFAQDGWEMTPGSVRDLDGLPLYVRKEDGESRLTPCAETLLTDSETEEILDRGLMAVVTRRESDAIRFPRFQSIREPATPLAGPWASRES